MFGIGKHGPDGRYGAIIDIGSSSVGVAVVASDPLQTDPEFIWVYREQVPPKRSDSIETAAKNITTALINAFLTLGADGVRALTAHEKGAQIEVLQVAISAPWSYTITKTVSCEQEEPFSITKTLVEDLITTAQKQALEAIDENDIMHKFGLQVIARATINISANGYNSEEPFGQEAKSLAVSHTSAISQQHLLDALTEGIEKVLPNTTLERYSFMLIFYCVLKKMAPDTKEVCLVDVTSEATELGIIRDGVLRYVTHAPFGIHTIARDIASLCKITFEEALAYIEGATELDKTLKPSVQEELQIILDTYDDKMTELFMRTGDQLAIPRPLFIHTDTRTEQFFAEHIKKAAANATNAEHGVHLVTQKLLGETTVDDTALLLSAHFFHKMHTCVNFTLL